MTDATLRAATNADAEVVRDLVFSVLREYGLKSDPDGTDSDLRDLEASYHARGGAFDVLVDGSAEIIGSVGLLRVDGVTCELRKMYLLPRARGRGLGKRLLDHALARARDLGYRRVVLETATALKEAIALYERRGFRRYHPAHLSNRCDAAYALDLPPRTDPGR